MEQEEILLPKELVSDTKLQYTFLGFEALLREKYCVVED